MRYDALAARLDVDAGSRPVVAFRAFGVEQDWVLALHQHRKSQILYMVNGMLQMEMPEGVWIAPPQCALWIPPGKLHSAAVMTPDAESCCLFLEPELLTSLPEHCCTIAVTPLLRELLLTAAEIQEHYVCDGPDGRLMATLVDQLSAASIEHMHLPMPRTAKLRELTEYLVAHPADHSTVSNLAKRIGMSDRTLMRSFTEEVGISLGRWRRQLHVILALKMLNQGMPVQLIADQLGYEAASGFINMFRRTVGKPPARFLAEWKEKAPVRR